MNKLQGHIVHIETHGNLSMVTLEVAGQQQLKSLVLDTVETAPYLKGGNKAQALFKETEVIITLQADLPISIQNKIPGRISAIENGAVLSRVTMESNSGKINCIIPASSSLELQLKEGMEACALVKFNEIMLAAE